MWEREPCRAPLNMHNAATSARRGDGGRAARSEHSSGDIRIWGPPGRTGPRPSADHVTETSKHRTAPKVTTAQCQTEPGFPEDNPAHGGSPGQHVLLQKVKGGGTLVRPPRPAFGRRRERGRHGDEDSSGGAGPRASPRKPGARPAFSSGRCL